MLGVGTSAHIRSKRGVRSRGTERGYARATARAPPLAARAPPALLVLIYICLVQLIETYSSSGLLKKRRSREIKQKYLRSRGLKKLPYGYQIDHIHPLFLGGQDTLENMQLLPISVHQDKTKAERYIARLLKVASMEYNIRIFPFS